MIDLYSGGTQFESWTEYSHFTEVLVAYHNHSSNVRTAAENNP
jgi:hypothetical protein